MFQEDQALPLSAQVCMDPCHRMGIEPCGGHLSAAGGLEPCTAERLEREPEPGVGPLLVCATESGKGLLTLAVTEPDLNRAANPAGVVLAEAEVPKAMAEALRSGNLGVMDLQRLKNIESDTQMRERISRTGGSKPPESEEP